MKLILREYLASLKERDELDAILPDLLSELGFIVISRPRRGTRQNGVDIAAVSPEAEGNRSLFLFTLKSGNLTRQDWDGTPQALRGSLNEICEVYIRNNILPEHRHLNVVVCLCFGGEIQEQVRPAVTAFIEKNTSSHLRFEEWNGDKLAGLLVEGVLREELLPKPLRSVFQKAVALLDEPDISYGYFASLIRQLHCNEEADDRTRVRIARQIYICVWVMFVWARDNGNVEAAYKACELAILNVWDLGRPLIGMKKSATKDIGEVFTQLVTLNLTMASEFLEARIGPHCRTRDALSMAVRSQSYVDVNLRLFDLLGRFAMAGLWIHYVGQAQEEEVRGTMETAVSKYCDLALAMIENNPALWLPVADNQATQVCLFLMLCNVDNVNRAERVSKWLNAMVHRYSFNVLVRDRYPTSMKDYRDLIHHPRDRSKEYFESATVGSTLIPLLAAWTAGYGRGDLVATLSKMVAESLPHCTMQLWVPDRDSEQHFYINSAVHGRAVLDLPITESGFGLLERIRDACKKSPECDQLSAIRTGFWPVVLLACLHWKLPVPANIWINALSRPEGGESNGPS